jgi:Concanavalin A-like lectin/glucanases superfamily
LHLTTGMTLEAWLNPATVGGWTEALGKETTDDVVYSIYSSQPANHATGYIRKGGVFSEAGATSALAVNTWTHVATTYDGATLRFFVNGTQVGSSPATGPIDGSSGVFRIGGNSIFGEYFNGLIDEVRVYNRALSSTEINADENTAVVSGTQLPPTTTSTTGAPTTTSTTGAPTTTTTSPSTPPPPSGTRDPSLWPFAVTSPWNMPIGSGAQFAAADDVRNTQLHSANAAINAGYWSHPIYQASITDPIRSVDGGSGNVSYRIPDGATPALPIGGDMHMHVIDPTKHWVDECWDVTSAGGGNWYTPYHVRNDLYGPGVGQGGVRAYGGSAIGGEIRTWEIQAGAIKHALAFGLPPSLMAHGPLWPATTEDGATVYSGTVHMGSLFAIPASVNVNALGLSAQGLMLAHAFQDYGAYLVDASGNFSLDAEPSAEGMIGPMRNDIGSLLAKLQIVTNNSAVSVGGGGTPRVSLAPALG